MYTPLRLALGDGPAAAAAVPAGQLLSVARSRKGAPGAPPQPSPHFQGLRALALLGGLSLSPRQMPTGRLMGRSRDVFNRCISKRAFVPETRASPAASHAATRDVAAMQKHFPLRLFFLLAESNFCFFKKTYMQTTARRHGYCCMLLRIAYFTSLDL